jgi:hypothetical protein
MPSLVPLNCFELLSFQHSIFLIVERYLKIIKENNVFESLKQIYGKSKSSKNVEIKSLCEKIIHVFGDTAWNQMRETPTKKQKTC